MDGTAVVAGGARVVTGTEATGTVPGADGEGTEADDTVTVYGGQVAVYTLFRVVSDYLDIAVS